LAVVGVLFIESEIYRHLDSPMASVAKITVFHETDSIAALQRAEATQPIPPEDRARDRIGADGKPVYREAFRAKRCYTGRE